MNRTQIYLPKNHRDKLRKIAQKKNTTVSSVIRAFIEEGMRPKTAEPVQKKRRTLLNLLAEVKRYGEKGPRDLAENVDQYLYGGKK